MTVAHHTLVPNYLFRWDEMSTGSCRMDLPWSDSWGDAVERLRSAKIDRVLARGDSTGQGRCRFEAAAGGIRIADEGSDPLAHQLLALFSSVIEPLAEGHSQLYVGEEAFFSSGRKRFDFNACIDLRDGTDIRIVVHVSAACGLVYMLNVSPRSATSTTPQIAREEGAVRA